METDWVRNYIVKMVWSGVERESFEGGKRGASYALVYPHNREMHKCMLSKILLHTAQHILERTVMR